jgi:hypothetical protein
MVDAAQVLVVTLWCSLLSIGTGTGFADDVDFVHLQVDDWTSTSLYFDNTRTSNICYTSL